MHFMSSPPRPAWRVRAPEVVEVVLLVAHRVALPGGRVLRRGREQGTGALMEAVALLIAVIFLAVAAPADKRSRWGRVEANVGHWHGLLRPLALDDPRHVPPRLRYGFGTSSKRM